MTADTQAQGDLVALAKQCGATTLDRYKLVNFSHEALEAFAAALQGRAQEGEPSDALQPTTETVPVGEIVALRRNAARYKVLRDARHGFNAYRLQPKPGKRWRGYGDEGDILKGEALDAAIDAARAAVSQKERT